MEQKDKFEFLKEMLIADRSVRRFVAVSEIEPDILTRLVELTRYCASGRNLQPLRYRIVTDETEKKNLFPALKWAGYYKNWDGPSEKERPGAYLVQCLATGLAPDCLCDDGLQLQAITLGATALGLSCCIIKAFNKSMVRKALQLPERFEPRYVVALGYASETVRIVDMQSDDDYKYYRNADDEHCVPKQPLDKLIIK